ncbi:MnmC family methyltransferase [Dyadobacter sp. NIV53]|uniref:MnmC family methyltransferase n=1 Tax=Dyadobacter sp. NIV53 TaxID=2861765 RepID=UPI001E64AD30|nr:MnmC family methyltransferase [Dyadobacter sp. NIV53]
MPEFLKIHTSSWGADHQFSEFFSFQKEKAEFEKYTTDQVFDVIFYDAFDPKSQPELWTEEIFSKIAAQTCHEGALVTYSSKGIVKRALRAAGFEVKRYPGPGMKTHVLRAIKIK